MRRVSKGASAGGAGLLLLLGLACGGGIGGMASGSPAAQSLCAHLEKTEECPCEALAVGTEAVIDDVKVVVDKVITWTGKSSLPEIKNSTERARMKKTDNHAVVVELSYTNTKPVKTNIDFVAYLVTGDGEEVFVQPYNSEVYMEGKEGWIDLWKDDNIGPNKTRHTAMVYAVPASAVEGSLLVLRRSEKLPDPKDPRGRKKYFVQEQLVLDLGPPT